MLLLSEDSEVARLDNNNNNKNNNNNNENNNSRWNVALV